MLLPRKQYNSHAPQQASYHLGPIFHNGAADFIYNRPVDPPVETVSGPGVPTDGQFNVLQPYMLRATLAVPVASVQGAGIVAGDFQMQQLIDQSNVAAEQNAAQQGQP